VLKALVFGILFTGFMIYTIVVYTIGTTGPLVIMNEKAKNGKLLFQKYNCTSCHQLYGLGGYLGPELTTTMSQNGKGKDYAIAFIKSGSQRMPDFHLSETEQNDLVEYLTYVDATAQYKMTN